MPILPNIEISLIETIPANTDTKINGRTIIFKRIKNIEDMVLKTIFMFSKIFSFKNRLLSNSPTKMPNNIANKTLFVKLIKL